MSSVRRTSISLLYDGVNISRDIAPFLISLTYTDQSHGKSDDLQIALQDVKGDWKGSWFPEKGASLTAEIHVENWLREGDNRVLPCGKFQIDEITFKGPPSTIDIKAVSVPVTSSARQQKRTKGWEDIKLSKIADEIASNHGLSLFWDSSDDPLLERRDQIEMSDLAFLKQECERAGLALKVTDDQVVIFREQEYEDRGVVDEINFASITEKLVTSFSFRTKATGTFKGAKVQYSDPASSETFEVYTSAENIDTNGQDLNVNERVTSEAEAEKLAQDRLYQANKREVTGLFSMVGNMAMLGGSMIDVVGFGKFDGKYFIEKAVHSYSRGGYTTQIDVRKGGAKASGAVPNMDFDVYGGDDDGL